MPVKTTKMLQKEIDDLKTKLADAEEIIEENKVDFDKKLAMQMRDIEHYKALASEGKGKRMKKRIMLLRQAVDAQLGVTSEREQDMANNISRKALDESHDMSKYVLCLKKPKGYLCKNGDVEMIDFSSYGKKWKPLFVKA